MNSNDISEEERSSLQKSVQVVEYGTMAAKATFVGLMLASVNWKKSPGFLKRELPLACLAVFGCFLIDNLVGDYAWRRNEEVVKRVTGFNGTTYVGAESMKNMQQMYKDRKRGVGKDMLKTDESELIN